MAKGDISGVTVYRKSDGGAVTFRHPVDAIVALRGGMFVSSPPGVPEAPKVEAPKGEVVQDTEKTESADIPSGDVEPKAEVVPETKSEDVIEEGPISKPKKAPKIAR